MILKLSLSSADSAARAQEAIEVFTAAYADYKKYAWGHDALAPISKAAIDGTSFDWAPNL